MGPPNSRHRESSSSSVSARKWSFQPGLRVERHQDQELTRSLTEWYFRRARFFLYHISFFSLWNSFSPGFSGRFTGGVVQRIPPRGNRSNFLIKSKSLSCALPGGGTSLFPLKQEEWTKNKKKVSGASPSRNKRQPLLFEWEEKSENLTREACFPL